MMTSESNGRDCPSDITADLPHPVDQVPPPAVLHESTKLDDDEDGFDADSAEVVPRCSICGKPLGEFYDSDSDYEPCLNTAWQLFSCWFESEFPEHDPLLWDDDCPDLLESLLHRGFLWPGVAECREFGWFARFVESQGWVPCGPEELGATEDLNRLYGEARWDQVSQRFVR